MNAQCPMNIFFGAHRYKWGFLTWDCYVCRPTHLLILARKSRCDPQTGCGACNGHRNPNNAQWTLLLVPTDAGGAFWVMTITGMHVSQKICFGQKLQVWLISARRSSLEQCLPKNLVLVDFLKKGCFFFGQMWHPPPPKCDKNHLHG